MGFGGVLSYFLYHNIETISYLRTVSTYRIVCFQSVPDLKEIFREFFLRYRFTIDPNALSDSDQVRRGIKSFRNASGSERHLSIS